MTLTQLHRILFSAVLGGLFGLASFSAAAADAPVTGGPFRQEGTVPLADCGSFQVLDRYELNYTTKLYFDKKGTLVKIVDHAWGTDVLVNSVTGEEYPIRFHNNVIIDPPANRGAVVGVLFRLTIPGEGAVFLDVGRFVQDRAGTVYFQAGPHQAIDGDFASLCKALA